MSLDSAGVGIAKGGTRLPVDIASTVLAADSNTRVQTGEKRATFLAARLNIRAGFATAIFLSQSTRFRTECSLTNVLRNHFTITTSRASISAGTKRSEPADIGRLND